MIPYFVYRLASLGHGQIKYTLPRKFWDRVSIRENNEILVPYDGFYIRTSLIKKLDEVKKNLPEGMYLKLIDGYRSRTRQREAWNKKFEVVKFENPDWSSEKIEQEVGLVIARPLGITNHMCGGAVDVCLVDSNGTLLDFGTDYAAADRESRSKCPMFAKNLTVEQKKNRKILRNAMAKAGFVYYPGEWWHYCYGDRMWAVYTGRTKCMYGPIENYEQ